jgi:hypothetical protein
MFSQVGAWTIENVQALVNCCEGILHHVFSLGSVAEERGY